MRRRFSRALAAAALATLGPHVRRPGLQPELLRGAGAIAMQPDGKIVVGGSVYEDQAIARYRTR
jgi:hypothetical protein